MLRPNDVFEWFKERSAKGLNETSQLIDGLLIGGQIVIGGAEANVASVLGFLNNRQRVGQIKSIQQAKLRPTQSTTFDTAAVLQLIMMAKNENFFQTIEMAVAFIEAKLAEGVAIEIALEQLRLEAAKVPAL